MLKFSHYPRVHLLFALLVCGSSVFAEEIDAVEIAPEYFKVLLENDYVRVLEYHMPAGVTGKWHTHPPKVAYVLDSGTLKITTAKGEVFIVDEVAGEARWMDRVGKHYGENIGDTTIRILLMEVKNVDTKPEDMTKYR